MPEVLQASNMASLDKPTLTEFEIVRDIVDCSFAYKIRFQFHALAGMNE